jgi:hypothetical protein
MLQICDRYLSYNCDIYLSHNCDRYLSNICDRYVMGPNSYMLQICDRYFRTYILQIFYRTVTYICQFGKGVSKSFIPQRRKALRWRDVCWSGGHYSTKKFLTFWIKVLYKNLSSYSVTVFLALLAPPPPHLTHMGGNRIVKRELRSV